MLKHDRSFFDPMFAAVKTTLKTKSKYEKSLLDPGESLNSEGTFFRH